MSNLEKKLDEVFRGINSINLDSFQDSYLIELAQDEGFNLAEWPLSARYLYRGGKAKSSIPGVTFFALSPFYAAQYGSVSAYKHDLKHVADLVQMHWEGNSIDDQIKHMERTMLKLSRAGLYDGALLFINTGYSHGTGYEVAVFDLSKVSRIGQVTKSNTDLYQL
jgi:hypothetical protein